MIILPMYIYIMDAVKCCGAYGAGSGHRHVISRDRVSRAIATPVPHKYTLNDAALTLSRSPFPLLSPLEWS